MPEMAPEPAEENIPKNPKPVQAVQDQGGANNIVANGPQITFTKSDPAIAIDTGEDGRDPDFPGLTKEELMQYINDPYWVKVRWFILISFWVVWFAMLTIAIILIVLAPRCPVKPDVKWWEHSVIYEIQPKTFQDSDGDGIGDIRGISSRIDHLEEMNVKAVGLSGIFATGNGNGVADYKAIEKAIGTMEDLKDMLKKMHRKGLYLILDLIPKAHNGSQSLNLRSSATQAELLDMAGFWLDNGIDGFQIRSGLSPSQPESFDLLAELRNMMDNRYENPDDSRITPFNKPARVLIIEAQGTANQTASLVTHGNRTGANMVLNSALLDFNKNCATPCVAKKVTEYLNNLPKGAKTNWKLGDELHQRLASRTKEGATRVSTMLLMTLPGAPFVLYGDEIAMRDGTDFNSNKNTTEYDPLTPMQWTNEINAGFTTNDQPWKAINPSYVTRNVKAGTAHGAGTTDMEVFMDLTKLRNEPSFIWGRYERVHLPTPDIFAYVRQAEGFKGYLVAINFPADGAGITNSYADFHQAMPELIPTEAEIVMTTENFPEKRWTEYKIGMIVSMEQFFLQPGEGVIFALPWKHKTFSL